MSAPSLSTEAGLAGSYPALRFNARERVLLSSVKAYVDAGLGETLTNTHILVGNASNVATDVALSGDATMANTGAMTIAASAITSGKIASAAVTLAKLAAGITPSHICVFAGKYTTTGGAATEAQTIAGLLSTDIVVATLQAHSSTQTLILAVPTSNTLTYTFSADPSSSTIVSYSVMRAAA